MTSHIWQQVDHAFVTLESKGQLEMIGLIHAFEIS